MYYMHYIELLYALYRTAKHPTVPYRVAIEPEIYKQFYINIVIEQLQSLEVISSQAIVIVRSLCFCTLLMVL